MKPILYDSGERDFQSLGLGILTDCVSCVVTEEQNGIFELDMVYPEQGLYAAELTEGRYIKADASKLQKGQVFIVSRVERTLTSDWHVVALHISSEMAWVPLDIESVIRFDGSQPQVRIRQTTPKDFLKKVKTIALSTGNASFNLSTDIEGLSDIQMDAIEGATLRGALMGDGGFLSTWGGELQKNNVDIAILKRRGENRGVRMAYSKNIEAASMEVDTSELYTSVMVIGKRTLYDGDGKAYGYAEVFTSPKVIDGPHQKDYPLRRVKVLMMDGEDATVSAVTQYANDYIRSENIGLPSLNIRLTALDMSRVIDFKEADREIMEVGDDVAVYIERLHLDMTVRVVRLEWNVLDEAIEAIEVGTPKKGLADVFGVAGASATGSQTIHLKNEGTIVTDSATGKDYYVTFESKNGEPSIRLVPKGE